VSGHPRDAETVDFDDGNESELAAHQITASEVVQLLENLPVWAPNKKGRAGVWLAIGYTDGGRVLTVPVTYDESRLQVRPSQVGTAQSASERNTCEDMKMNENELAAELQGSKDDASEWGEATSQDALAKTGKRRLAAMVSVRLAPEELELVQQRAEELGQTVSAYLRAVAMREVTRQPSQLFVGISMSTKGTYYTRVQSPRIMEDGRRLPTYVS